MSFKKQHNSKLVYSTESGRMCPTCEKPVQNCACKQQRNASNVPKDGIVRLARETKGRKGKGVTLVHGLSLAPDELSRMAKTLKQKCGTGGTVKNDVIEIQGDQRETLAKLLEQQGYTVKIAGG